MTNVFEEVGKMKRAALAVLVLLLATGIALGGQNPDLMIGFEVTNPPTPGGTGVRIDPTPMTPFYVYVVFTGFGPSGGLLGSAFRFNRTFAGFKLSFENLMGGLMIGDPEVAPGVALTSGANPVYPTSGMLVVARVQYMATGTAGTMTFLCHGTDGCVAADVNNDLDTWEVYSNLGVYQDAPASPVTAESWGAIKALYR